MKLSLLVLTSGTQRGTTIDIRLPQFLVGRDPQCQLRPASPLISKRHCAIIQRDGKAFIRDFDSTNGTFVNDEPVKGERELHHDDQLKIGPILFTVRIEPDAAGVAKTPAPAQKPAEAEVGLTGAQKLVGPSKTPRPPTKPITKTASDPADTAVASSGGDDDDIAAMLLSTDEDGPTSAGLTSEEIPDGSTIMDMTAAQPGVDSKQPAKPSVGDTRAAAARILEKMTRRPRS